MIRHIDELRQMAPRRGLKFRVLPPEEAARVRARDHVDRNAHKLPPSEYTRILLRAKEGDIAPGKADSLISKLGGRVRVRPLPKFPQ